MAKTSAAPVLAGDAHPFQHEEADVNPNFWGCGYCSQVFFEQVQLATHLRLLHDGEPYCCEARPLNPDQAELLQVPRKTLHEEGVPMAEVARHNVPNNCWVALGGKVYDLTEFLDRHPGGRNSLLAWMGKDATKMFNDVHGGVNVKAYLRPDAYIGALGIKEDMMSPEYWDQLRQQRVQELRTELSALPAPRAVAEPYEGAGIPMAEVERHNRIQDCWVVQNGQVLDLTDFVAFNPEARNPILARAGRDATEAFNKIPGRFPSDSWNAENLRPEYVVGELRPARPASPKEAKVLAMRRELHLLEGPSDADREAAAAQAAAAQAAKSAAVTASASSGETERFPKLKDIQANRGALPLFTRADVAQHNGGSADPYIILHNKVYDLKPLMGNHPGGDEVLLSRAGTDCTVDFEVFEHSEKSRIRRDQDMLVGEIVPEERQDATAAADATGATEQGAGQAKVSELERYLRYRAWDVALGTVLIYLYRSLHHTKPLPKLMYSRALRHMHLIMAAGIFATLGTAQAASFASGHAKKKLITLHKQTGLAMLAALVLRAFVRLRSGIPPRFPGFSLVQFVESQSLRAFYALALALPVSGVAYEYFSKWAPALQNGEDQEADERNERAAKASIVAHKKLGKFFNRVWLPFHMGYTTLYHYSQGRGVWRKVSPFI